MSKFTQTGAVQNALSNVDTLADRWVSRGAYSADFGDSDPNSMVTVTETVDLRLAMLAQAIEEEIIPRLMLAHRAREESLSLTALEKPAVSRQDVESFAKLVLSRDTDVSQACIETMRARGLTVETIFLDLLAPVARYMGELWDQDLCDFTEVTIGLGRLHQVLRELSPAFAQSSDHGWNGRRILLLPCPGEQHTFGLVMVSEFFRRAGWDVAGGPWEAGADPVVMVRREWFDVVGFSVGTACHLDDLGECIQAVRQAALNRHVGIMVGGPIFGSHPEHATHVGADCATTDGRQAPVLAEQLTARMKKGC